MEPILIQPDSPGTWYAVFYAAAFVVGFALLAWEGRRQKFPALAWWLILATAFLFFMIGSQVIRWNTVDWGHALRFEPLERWTGRSVLGGIVLFVPALCLAKYLLRFSHSVVDSFALVFPVGLAIQRIGCFITGCCFGTPTQSLWGVQYGTQAEAFHLHSTTGLLPAGAEVSLPVHPVQLYDLLCCGLIVVMVWRIRRHVKTPGNLLATSLFLYGGFRFFLEFVRAPLHAWNFSLTPVQVGLSICLPLLGLWIWKRERSSMISATGDYRHPSLRRLIAYFILYMVFFLIVSKWLSRLEIVSIHVVLIPFLGLMLWKLFTACTVPSLRVATVLLMGVSLVLMSQTAPEYATDSTRRLRYWSAGFGITGGMYDVTKESSPGCGGPTFTSTFKNKYSAQAATVSYTNQLGPEESVVYRLSGFAGHHQETQSTTLNSGTTESAYANWGISPYVEGNWRKVGLGLGFTAGNFVSNRGASAGQPSAMQVQTFAPSYHFRFGVFKKGYLEYRVANQFPTPFPALANQIVLGFGFGRGGGLRIGTSTYATIFLEPTIQIGDHLLLQPLLSIGGGFSSTGESNASQISMSLHYKFGRQERQAK